MESSTLSGGIVRKDKRLNKTGHLLAFTLTGGMSSVYTAAKAATNAGYNARTRKLLAQAEETEQAEVAAPDKAECPRCGARYVLVPTSSGRVVVKKHYVPRSDAEGRDVSYQGCELSGQSLAP